MNPTKVWAVIFAAVAIPSTARVGAASDYEVTAESIENFPEVSREYADWHLSLTRITKTEKVIDGHYTVKKDIVRPKAQLETYFLTNNKFVKVDINHPKRDLCDNSTASFIEEYFEGNSTHGEDCIIKPGYMEMRKDRKINLNELAHKEYRKVFYGIFKLVVTIMNEEDDVVGKVGWTVSAKKKKP